MDFMFSGPNAQMGLQALMGAKGAMGKIGPDTPNPFALTNQPGNQKPAIGNPGSNTAAVGMPA